MEFINLWTGRRGHSTGLASLIAVGDIMLSREVGEKISRFGPRHPFRKIRSVLCQADVVFGNLEAPLSSRGSPVPFVQTSFRADPAAVDGLAWAGFRVLSVANNHIYDYGARAVEDTIYMLKGSGIEPVGLANSPEGTAQPVVVLADSGIRIGFLAYTSAYNAIDPRNEYTAAPIDLPMIESDVRRMKEEADICVVSLHFGYENVEYPPPECRGQARRVIEFGTDLVVGHHPHVLHGLERHRDGMIAYSLGNFVFDNLNERRREGAVFRVTFDRDGLRAVDLLPIWINDDYQPQVASEEATDGIIRRIKRLSSYLEDGSSDRKFWQRAGVDFLSNQRTGFSVSIRRDGLYGVLTRLKRFRVFHLKLLLFALIHRIRMLSG